MLSKFNSTSTPKGSYRFKTSDNDCNVNSSHYILSTALRESIRYQAKSEQNHENVRQDLIPRVRHGEAALCTSVHHESSLAAPYTNYEVLARHLVQQQPDDSEVLLGAGLEDESGDFST